jgi:transposase
LRPLKVTEEGGGYVIEAEGMVLPTQCPDCKSDRLYGHGTNIQNFRDTPSHGKAVTIAVHRRRFRCQACGKTLFDPTPELDSKRLATCRLVNHIRSRCFRETFAAIARDVDFDEKTVRNVFADFVEELQTKIRFETPRILGIDEIKIIGGYRAMITNIERKTLFDMLENRSKADLLPYFKAMPDKDKIEWVTMDMYHVYRQVVRSTLPQARIIVDRFHIQRMGNEALEAIRKQIRKTLPERKRLALKDERFLLLARQHNLSPAQADRMLSWFRDFPQLSEAHALKEDFFSIWDNRTRTDAEAAYGAWLASIPRERSADFRKLTTAMANWSEEIFSYFENPITNAYTESVNNLVKAMNRMGRGYSFDVIRARMLFDPKARKDGSVVITEPAKEEGNTWAYFTTGSMKSRQRTVQRTVQRVIEYGPYIPTLVKLLDEGHFE